MLTAIPPIRAGNRFAGILLAVSIFTMMPPCGVFAAQQAVVNPGTGGEADTTAAKVQQLLLLLADPRVQKSLDEQVKSAPKGAEETQEAPISSYWSARLTAIREHLIALLVTLPDLPNQFERATGMVSADLGTSGRIKMFLLILGFLVSGISTEWLFRRATQGPTGRIERCPMETVNDRL